MDIREQGRAARQSLAILIDHLRPIRVPLLVVISGALAALTVDQVEELFWLSLLPQPGVYWYTASLVVGILLGAGIWYSARNAYRLRYPRWPHLSVPQAQRFRVWIPRLLGASVPLLLAIGCMIAWRGATSAAERVPLPLLALKCGLLLLASTLLLWAFVKRIAILNRLRARAGLAPLPATADQPQVNELHELGRAPIVLLCTALVLNLVLMIAIVYDAETLSPLGPATIVLLAGLFFCVSGGTGTLFADRFGLPLLSALVALATLWQMLGVNDNHLVRQHAGMSTHSLSAGPALQRARFDEYLAAWLKVRCPGAGPCVVVLVSAEGGGVRAAAWTHLVLAELDARTQGEFSRRWFAGSGVSGGSLGLATHAVSRLGTAASADVDAATAFYATDFLSPTLANLFFVDLVTQRLLPIALFDDRGRALSRAWERAAELHLGSSMLAAPFSALYKRPDGTIDVSAPLLLLNSTAVDSGARVVQHGLDALPGADRGAWPGAIDGSTVLSAALPLSEAALNSARFSYVSPAGTVGEGSVRLQLVDGGYFENSGTTSLLDLIEAIRRGADRELVFRIVHISNDVAAVPFSVQTGEPGDIADACPDTRPAASTPSGELRAPVNALLATRAARGDYARRMLLRSLGERDRLWHFRLCDAGRQLPLGWTISREGLDEMRRQIAAWLTPQAAIGIVKPSP